ncbi:MAG TPA: threonine synthase [Acidobacteriaceae bacterium]
MLRCTGCGARIRGEEAQSNFRCVECGDLFEVEYPWSESAAAAQTQIPSGNDEQKGKGNEGAAANEWHVYRPNAGALKHLWQSRKTSTMAVDQSGVWRFRDLLPIVAEDRVVTLREGNTPLYEMPRAAAALGLNWLLAKHQGMNPTGSFKDTGMTAALSVAVMRGFGWVACASTGNTSAAMAAYAARAGLKSLVLIPEGKIAWGKLSQSMDYGSTTVQLRTDFDGCVRVLGEIVRRAPVYLLNSVNPYRSEGQKTPAFEILEQMEWQVPQHIVVPGGNLANGAALGKGFAEMKHLGFIHRVPKISVVQAEGANPLYRYVQGGGVGEFEPVVAETRASAIRIGNPASWKKTVKMLAATGGWVEQVNEREIALAKAEIGAEGMGCEPASAVTLAGLKKLVADGRVGKEETVVLVLTGHTLKDPEYTINFHRGELLSEDEMKGSTEVERAGFARLRREPLVMDADAEAVLRELDREAAVAGSAS